MQFSILQFSQQIKILQSQLSFSLLILFYVPQVTTLSSHRSFPLSFSGSLARFYQIPRKPWWCMRSSVELAHSQNKNVLFHLFWSENWTFFTQSRRKAQKKSVDWGEERKFFLFTFSSNGGEMNRGIDRSAGVVMIVGGI